MSVVRDGVVVPRADSERTRAALVAAGWLDAGVKPKLVEPGLIALPVRLQRGFSLSLALRCALTPCPEAPGHGRAGVVPSRNLQRGARTLEPYG